MKANLIRILITISALAMLMLTACASMIEVGSAAENDGSVTDHMDGGEHMDGVEHMDGDEHMDAGEHMGGAHDIPDEAADVQNPVPATAASIAAGQQAFASSCAVCHGENGRGDGPTAATLDPKPADLREGHVQGLSDGGLFHIISVGRPNTAMPAWEDALTEEVRWNLVNFLRTLAP